MTDAPIHPFAYLGPRRIYTARDRRFLIAQGRGNTARAIRWLRAIPNNDRRVHGVLMRLLKRQVR